MSDDEQIEMLSPSSGRLLKKCDWIAFAIATIVSFVVYFYTLAPTLSLEDSGELAVAGDYLGVPHPPGYPLWTILAWIFARIFQFKTYFGQPNPGWSIALMSAVFAALTAGVMAMLVCCSGRDMLQSIKRARGADSDSTDDLICCGGGIAGSLLFAFSPVMWSQAVIVEVYTLNAFFVVLIFQLAYMWSRKPSDKLLFATALAFGLGMGNWWPSVLLTIGPLTLLIMFKDLKLFRDFAIVGAVIVAMLAINVVFKELGNQTNPANPSQSLHPLARKWLWTAGPHATPFYSADKALIWKYIRPFWIYFIVNLIAIGLGWRFLPRGRTVALTILLVELGLLIYVYMPLSSDLRNPPMNWGYPRTWQGFMHAVNRGQYEKVAPTDVFSKRFIAQLGSYMTELRCQFTMPVALLGFLPFVGWSIKIDNKRISALLVAAILASVAVVLVFMEKYGVPVSVLNIRIYMVLLAGVLALLILGFVALVMAESADLIAKLRDKIDTSIVEKILVGAVFAFVLALLAIYELSLAKKLIGAGPETQAAAAAAALIPLTAFEKLFVIIMMAGPLFLAGGVGWAMSTEIDMRFDVDRDSQTWILITVVGFFLMSIAMIVGANPKGDIQDMFIQRVKFIASHELFGFWVGYGLILGLALLRKLFKGNQTVVHAGVAIALIMPIYPVIENAPFYENRFNKELIRVYGGASQRKHDFGWQFGRYQLEGVAAINEEMAVLEPDAPRPPSATYPLPMGPDAIFFGGTDPGRFVPTYMIYSARVREDVYLITQNALADHTYMSVMRDLYGDRIWIPSIADNNQAFQEYADDVKSGRRAGNVDVKLGRVVVQGVVQVMAINGILCKQIHNHNKWKHDFYVEESYVMPWMYPYMEPHGLILKINAERLPKLTPEMVKNDMEFWAWYVKRLTSNDDFRYDAVARKSFSKLRSALAGLYEYRQMWKETELAYKEAIALCPVSPEAHFRLTGLYMKLGQFDKALALMEDFLLQDPNNRRVPDMIRQITSRKTMFDRKSALEKDLNAQKLSLSGVFELADIYRKLGNIGGFRQLTKGIMSNNPPPDAYLSIARMYVEQRMNKEMAEPIELYFKKVPDVPANRYKHIAELYAQAQQIPKASQMMRKYVAAVPFDVHAWIELGVMYTHMNKGNEALSALQQAIRVGGDKAKADIKKDGRLAPLRRNPQFAQLIGTVR